MIERHQEADILRSLAEAYQGIVEARRNAGTGGGGKQANYVQNAANTPVGHVEDQAGKGVVHTGMDKMKADAKSEKKQMDKQAAADKEARQERARANKEKKAKAGIDDVLRDIRGK